MIKAVLDTNIIISGIIFGGKPRQILESSLKGFTQIYISEDIISELKGVLQRPKFNQPPEIIEIIISEFISISEWIDPAEHFNVIDIDPDDDIFLDCAFASKSEYIISGDKHLLGLKNWKGTKIVTPDQYLKKLLRRK